MSPQDPSTAARVMLCPRALGTLEVPQPDRREEKEESKDSKPWLADIRDKAQTEDGHSTARHGWSAGRRERSGRMKENHSPARERQNTSTHDFSQEQREEIMKDAITTVVFLYPFFLF